MFDFLSLIGNSRRYTFHSHTEFCDGRAQMEAFAREAVAQGFSHYGFSPHSPIPIASPCNMLSSNVDRYLGEVSRIRRDHSDSGVRFYAGMEIDYLGDDWGPSIDYFHTIPLDYSIGSVHFIPSQAGELVDIDGRFESFRRKMIEHFRDDIRYVVEKFYEQSIRMVEAGGFDIIGHLDKVGHNAGHYSEGIEDESWYVSLSDELVDKVIASGVTVELNTKAQRDHGRFFPSTRLLRKLVAAGAPIIVNSDAHVPALIDASRDEAFELLDSIKHS
ncbi:MAG: histidinol-phosphatase, partial [Muribaculaceae bacterium]|nr:histidinol-phosphatase [Muribaculaceae bacterium]